MNALTVSRTTSIFGANKNLLKVIRDGLCRDLTTTEFDTFVHIVDHTALDPIRGQIIPLVFHKDNPKKRRMVAITTINGYRTIAERTGTYAPSSKGPRVVAKAALRDGDKPRSKNPLGLVSVTVYGKKFVQGEWHEFSAKANWDEYAPYLSVWEYDRNAGKEVPVDTYLDKSGKWFTAGEMMLTKCAYAQLMRIGWPDDYGGNLYDPAEVDRWKTIDLLPHEYARVGTTDLLTRERGGPEIDIIWTPDTEIERVPAGVLMERIADFIRLHDDDLEALALFRERNKRTLMSNFFAHDRALYNEMVKLFLPFEDRYHGRRSSGYIERAQAHAPQKAPSRSKPRQEFSSGSKMPVRSDEEVITENDRWERIP